MFEYRLHPVSQVLGGLLMFPIDRARDLIRLYRQVTASAPDALGAAFTVTHAPDGTPVCALAICYNGPIDEGERAIKPFRDFGTPIAGEVGPVPYTATQTMVDERFRRACRTIRRSHFLTDLTEEGMDILIDQFSRVCRRLLASGIEDLASRRPGQPGCDRLQLPGLHLQPGDPRPLGGSVPGRRGHRLDARRARGNAALRRRGLCQLPQRR